MLSTLLVFSCFAVMSVNTNSNNHFFNIFITKIGQWNIFVVQIALKLVGMFSSPMRHDMRIAILHNAHVKVKSLFYFVLKLNLSMAIK